MSSFVGSAPSQPAPPGSAHDARLQPVAWGGLSIGVSALVLLEAWRKVGACQDDAYIFLRYADNLVHGAGLVYNPGERVEGFTSPLWQLLVVACAALRLDTVTAVGVMGTLATVGVVLVSVRDARRCGPPGPFSAVAPVTLALYAHFLVWAVSGMETSLFTLLLWAGISQYRCAVREARAPELATGVLLALASLTRPEGGVAVLALATDAGLRAARSPGGSARGSVGSILGPSVVAGTALLTARWLYYHDLLPNTFYAKMGGTAHHFKVGALYVWDFLRATPFVWCAAGLALPGAARRVPAFGAMVAVIGLWLLNVVRVGGDYMQYHRFLIPLAPLLFALGADGVFAAYEVAARRLARVQALSGAGAGARRLRGAAPALTAITVTASAVALGHDPIQFGEEHWFPSVLANARLGRVLGKTLPPDWKIGLPNIGAVGFYSHRYIVDLLGLVDRGLARRPSMLVSDDEVGWNEGSHDHFDVAWSFAQKPDVVAFSQAYGSEPFQDFSEVPCYLRVERYALDYISAGHDYVLRNVEIDRHVYWALFVRADRLADLARARTDAR
jgi:hypothetical protein